MSEQRPVGEVRCGDLRRLTPIAPNFGLERGRPVDRFYIERFLNENAGAVRGRVLEVGDDRYTRAYGGDRVRAHDILHLSPENPVATIAGDLTHAPHIPAETFDCIICTQTLQLIYDVHRAVATLHRILRPGGVLLATFPGISQIDDPSWGSSWYWSFTTASARRMFGDVFGADHVDVGSHGNVFAATCFLQGMVVEDVRREELEYTDPAFPLLITVRATREV
jgi:SAM-dependent methyltransferase